MFTSILCPIDGSETSSQALAAAAQLAAEQHAKLIVCTVVNPAQASAMAFGDPGMSALCLDALDDEGAGLLRDAVKTLSPELAASTARLDGPTVDSILECATKNACDVIVMGSHGRTGINRVLLGSVAEGVVRRAHIPVLIVRTAPQTTSKGRAGAAVPAQTASPAQ